MQAWSVLFRRLLALSAHAVLPILLHRLTPLCQYWPEDETGYTFLWYSSHLKPHGQPPQMIKEDPPPLGLGFRWLLFGWFAFFARFFGEARSSVERVWLSRSFTYVGFAIAASRAVRTNDELHHKHTKQSPGREGCRTFNLWMVHGLEYLGLGKGEIITKLYFWTIG